MTQEKKHGGYRPGAGRKPAENKRVQMVVTIKDTTKSTLKEKAKERNTSPGRLIDDLVDNIISAEDWDFVTYRNIKQKIVREIERRIIRWGGIRMDYWKAGKRDRSDEIQSKIFELESLLNTISLLPDEQSNLL